MTTINTGEKFRIYIGFFHISIQFCVQAMFIIYYADNVLGVPGCWVLKQRIAQKIRNSQEARVALEPVLMYVPYSILIILPLMFGTIQMTVLSVLWKDYVKKMFFFSHLNHRHNEKCCKGLEGPHNWLQAYRHSAIYTASSKLEQLLWNLLHRKAVVVDIFVLLLQHYCKTWGAKHLWRNISL
jgi:hypothetical protein